MTDGPFRNAELPSRWKRYGDDLVSDAVSDEERVARVCHNVLIDVNVKLFKSLWDALAAYAQSPQMDFDPVSSIETIFESHPKSPHSDVLQKQVMVDVRNSVPLEDALRRGLQRAAEEWREVDKNRFDEHCLSARDRGDMSSEDYRKGIDRNRDTFDAIDLSTLCNALCAGNKNAFRAALKKKEGVDEGPEE